MDPAPPAGHHALTYDQVQKLNRVLSDSIEIQPPNNFPPLSISPADIVKVVRQRLLEKDIKIRDVRLNGSAASHILCEEQAGAQIHFNDVDLIFGVSVEREYEFRVIKEEVVTSLLTFFPKEVSTEKISCLCLEEAYVRKMVLVNQGRGKDRTQWSLVSLGDGVNKSIELKFVSTMKRQFEFSVDSFHIMLDSFFDFDSCCTEESPVAMSRSFFPTVFAESMYSDFSEALRHLNNRLIDTVAPEEIRGGGLLKYCTLLVTGFQPADPEQMLKLEPYMCSRFFIDFPTVDTLYHKLHKYVSTRFLQRGEYEKCLAFLNALHRVVSSQAVCLMEAKRQETISIICNLRLAITPAVFSRYPYFHPPPPAVGHAHPYTMPSHPHMGPFVPPYFAPPDPSRVSPPPFVRNFPPKQWLPSASRHVTKVR